MKVAIVSFLLGIAVGFAQGWLSRRARTRKPWVGI